MFTNLNYIFLEDNIYIFQTILKDIFIYLFINLFTPQVLLNR